MAKARIAVILAVIAIIAVIVIGHLFGSSDHDYSTWPKGLLPLVPPAFAQETTFPVGQAGLAAYANIGEIDLDTIHKAIIAVSTTDEIKKASGAYIWASTVISTRAGNAKWQDTVDIYADVNGWIVAFLPRDANVASMLLWETSTWISLLEKDDWRSRVKGRIERVKDRNALEQVVIDVASEAGRSVREVKYYHFAFPWADRLIIGAKYSPGGISIVMPENREVAQAGVAMINTWSDGPTSFWIDNTKVSVDNERKLLAPSFTPGGHLVRMDPTGVPGSSSLAVVLVTGPK